MTIPSPFVVLPIAAGHVVGIGRVVLLLTLAGVILTAAVVGAAAAFVVTLASGLSKLLVD